MSDPASNRIGEAIDVATNLFSAEADGGERVLDLVGYAAGDLFPGGLLLRAKQFGGVFEDEDIALMLAAQAFGGGGHLEQSDGGEQVHGAAESAVRACVGAVISISLEAEPMRWLRLMRRSRTSTTSAGKTSSMTRP